MNVGRILSEHHFTVPGSGGRRPMRSQRFLVAATITGRQLGTTEVGGTTDFAEWIPIAKLPGLQPRADIIDVAIGLLQGSRR